MNTFLLNEGKETETAINIVSDLLRKNVISLQGIREGRNSQVYKIYCSDGTCYIAKHYFRHNFDPRNRLGVEFNALQFLHKNGITCVHKPLAMNLEQGWGIYEFVEGQAIASEEVTSEDITIAAQFLARINQLKGSPESLHFSPASEACFSLQAIVASIEQRLQRLSTVAQQTATE